MSYPPGMTDHDNWYHEKESAWLYLQVAAVEPDPAKADCFCNWPQPLKTRRPSGSLPR